MAKVIRVIQIVPASPDLDREDFVRNVIKEEIAPEAGVEFMGMKERPLVFGLYSIDVYAQASDSEEGKSQLDAFEKLLENREELQSVEVTTETLSEH
ncbi:MAG: hypothetical protein ACXAEU_22665 [Candidatus Hodarchaeales archaeon]|jgi:translation elongation factor aEF-1 beta